MPVSQNDIAKASGFSRPTVSRALTNHPGIPQSTRKKICEIADSLGYRKNALVSMLTSQIRASRIRPVSASLGYITSFPKPQVSNVYSPNYCLFHEGAKKRAEELGFALDCIWRTEPKMCATRFQKILGTRGIRGIIIAPRPKPLGHLLLDWTRVAAVSVGHPLPQPHIHHCSAWHYQIMDLALRNLAKLGYHRIGYAIPPDSDRYSGRSFAARFCLHRGSVKPSNRVSMAPWTTRPESATFPIFQKWFQKNQPDVIVSCGTRVLDWLRQLGVEAPRNVGYADLAIASPDSEISGVCEMSADVGAAAVDTLVEMVNANRMGLPDRPRSIFLEGKWVPGRTLRKVPQG